MRGVYHKDKYIGSLQSQFSRDYHVGHYEIPLKQPCRQTAIIALIASKPEISAGVISNRTERGSVLSNVTRILYIGGPEHLRRDRSQSLRIEGFETVEFVTPDRVIDVSRQLKPAVILISAEYDDDIAPVIGRLRSESVTSTVPIIAIVDTTFSERKEIRLLKTGVEFCLRSPSLALLMASVGAAVRAAQVQQDLRLALKQERLERHELSANKRPVVESGSLYREMGESFQYGLWMSDPAGRLTFVSDSFLALTECSLEQAAAGEWRKRIASEDVAGHESSWNRSLRTGERWEHEYRILGPDGEYHHVLSRGRPIVSDKGDILAWAGINLDLDERNRQEQHITRLAQSEEMLRRQLEAILNSVTQGLVMYDLKSGTISMNPAGQRLHGFTQMDMPLSADVLRATLRLSNAGGKEIPFGEWRLDRRRGRADGIRRRVAYPSPGYQ